MYCLFFQVPNGDLVIGAAVSLNTLINVLDNQAEKMSGYKVLADHVRKVITPIEILTFQIKMPASKDDKASTTKVRGV